MLKAKLRLSLSPLVRHPIALLPFVALVLGLNPVAGADARIAPASRLHLAQVSQVATPGGDRLTLNGQPLRVNWVQWNDPRNSGGLRTGISDFGLAQAIGLELLNTEDAAKQPVQWFSQPVPLATRRIANQRYLDITDLAEQSGWKLQAQGSVLNLSTPPAKVLSVRYSRQSWGDRLVLELDRPAAWQRLQQGQTLNLVLQAQSGSTLTGNSLKIDPTRSIKSLSVTPGSGNSTILNLTSNLPARIWSLPSPNRLIIDLRSDALLDRTIALAPGLRWRQQTVSLGSDRFPVGWLEVNPRQPEIKIKPILPNQADLAGTAPLTQTAKQNQVAAAINGGFFNRNNQLPLGAVRLDDRWISGPILNRGAIAWNSAGETLFDRLRLEETIVTASGQRLALTHLNSAYIQPGIARYTSSWGQRYTVLSDGEVAISVQAGQVVSQQSVKLGTAIPIPANGYLLVARSNPAALSGLAIGSTLQIESATTPAEFQRYPQILAAGPLLLKNKQIVLDAKAEGFSSAFTTERASRSAIGRTATGTLLLLTVHDRQTGPGPSLTELAQIMQQVGAIEALNLDGGSSTSLFLGGQVVDRSPRSSARVHNGIGIFLQPIP
ncbi:MAG TPA: phosphodiester glycosidase family protein [Thermosynechococcaceae cyanobacterium]